VRTSTRPLARTVLATCGLATLPLLPSAAAADTTGTLDTDPVADVAAASRVTVPADHAQAVFDAWLTGDGAALVDLTTPEVVQLLTSRPVGDEVWANDLRLCEGAAGSTYCTWASADVQLTLRVDNEAAGRGAAHAVVEAWFEQTPTAIALWPVTSEEQAWATQAQVDAGHSPWLTDPFAVVSFYASSSLGFVEPVVEAVSPTFFTYRVVDAATGVAVDVTTAQPARTGDGGIWAATRLASRPSHTDTPV